MDIRLWRAFKEPISPPDLTQSQPGEIPFPELPEKAISTAKSQRIREAHLSQDGCLFWEGTQYLMRGPLLQKTWDHCNTGRYDEQK